MFDEQLVPQSSAIEEFIQNLMRSRSQQGVQMSSQGEMPAGPQLQMPENFVNIMRSQQSPQQSPQPQQPVKEEGEKYGEMGGGMAGKIIGMYWGPIGSMIGQMAGKEVGGKIGMMIDDPKKNWLRALMPSQR